MHAAKPRSGFAVTTRGKCNHMPDKHVPLCLSGTLSFHRQQQAERQAIVYPSDDNLDQRAEKEEKADVYVSHDAIFLTYGVCNMVISACCIQQA